MSEWIVTGLYPDGITYPQMIIRSVPGRTGRMDSLGRIEHTLKFTIQTYPQVYQGLIWGGLANGPGIFIGAVWNLGSAGIGSVEKRFIYCTDIDIQEGDTPEYRGFWTATANFGPTDPTLLGLSAIPVDASLAPVRIDWDTWTEPFALYRDKDGHIIQNTAGDRFDEPVDSERRFPLLHVRRNERSFDPGLASWYWDKVNSTTWNVRGLSIPPRYAKCVNIVGNQQWHPQFGIFYEVDYQFAIRNQTWTDSKGVAGQGWDLNLQNTGFREKVGSSLEVVKDSNGFYVQAPVPLDLDGAALSVPLAADTEFPNITYRIYPEVDFNSAFVFPSAAPSWPPTDPTYG